MEKSISFFAPAFNEERNIKDFIKAADLNLKKITSNYEIIIVNDGSKDNTKGIVENLEKKYKNLRLINHEENRGYGEALKSGFKASTKDLVCYTDSDLQFDLSELSKLLDKIDDYPVVIGYRKNRQDNLIRRINAYLWKILIRITLGLNVRDIDCAFKIFRNNILNNLILESESALISAELLTRIKNKGYKIYEVPVSHNPRVSGKQTGANTRVILKAFKELIVLRKSIENDKKII